MKLETIIKYIDSECQKRSKNLDDVVLHLEQKSKTLMLNLLNSTNNIYGLNSIDDVVTIDPSKVSRMPNNNVKWFCYYIKYSQYRLKVVNEIKDKWQFLKLSDEKKYKLMILKEKIKFG